MGNDPKDKTQKRFLHGAGDEKRRAKLRSKLRKMQREDSMKNKVMVEVGDLERLKRAIESMEWLRNLCEDEQVLVDLAKRVVEAEEKIQEALARPVDIDSD
jgi:hypothetical protein